MEEEYLKREIVDKCLFTCTSERLRQLGGYIQTVDFNSKTQTEYKVLCLLKNKVIIRKISASFYSNIEELQEGLKSVNDFGFEKFGIAKKLKIFFKQPILE